jgi:hypothetical protein
MDYTPRQPIEIILNSKRGTNIGSLDGHKFFELEKEVVARKGEKILLYLKKSFIPFSFYCLSTTQKNNKLDVKETQTDGTNNSYTITIPDGNYNIDELISVIKSAMETASTFGFIYNFTYDDATNKITMRISSGTDVLNTTLLFGTGNFTNNSVRRILGFSNQDHTFTTTTGGISDNVCDLADGLDSLHLKSNLCGDNIQSTSGAINGGELLIIPVNLLPNSILYFDEGQNPFKHRLVMSSFKRIEMKFTDNNDNTVDFNNIPYTLILIAEFIQDFTDTLTPQTKNIENNVVENRRQIVEKEKENINLYKMMVNRQKDYI